MFVWKSVNQYNNTSFHLQKINVGYSALSKETETDREKPKFEVGDRVRITYNMRIFSVKFTLKIGQKNYMWLILSWKLILGQIKLKI